MQQSIVQETGSLKDKPKQRSIRILPSSDTLFHITKSLFIAVALTWYIISSYQEEKNTILSEKERIQTTEQTYELDMAKMLEVLD
jgi:hypothetical protein